MISIQQLETMMQGETITDGGYTVVKSTQKNGKEIWTVNGWVSRSPSRAISWIAWDKRQCLKFGGSR
jgi:hypothetical protein